MWNPWGNTLRQILNKLDAIGAQLTAMEDQMSALSDAVDKLTADDTALTAEVQQIITYLGTIPGQITAAVNAATAAGADPTTLAALAKVSADIETNVTNLTAAAAAAPQPAA